MIVVDDLKSTMGHLAELVINNKEYNELRIISLDEQISKVADYEPGRGYLEYSNGDRRLNQKMYLVTLFNSTCGLSIGMEVVEEKENE